MQPLELQENSQDSLSSIFNITREGFKEIQKSQMTLDQVFYLETRKHKINLKGLVDGDRLISWRQSLIRKGYLTESEEVTVDGLSLLDLVGSGLPFKGYIEERHSKIANDFDRWWTLYPSTDQFKAAGRLFEGRRSLRLQKEACRTLFEKIVNEGEFSAEDIIRATKYELDIKKQLSIKENVNNMMFMKNTHAYLNQKAFEGFVEISKTEIITKRSNEDI